MIEKKSNRKRVAVQLDEPLAVQLEEKLAAMRDTFERDEGKTVRSDVVRALLRKALAEA